MSYFHDSKTFTFKIHPNFTFIIIHAPISLELLEMRFIYYNFYSFPCTFWYPQKFKQFKFYCTAQYESPVGILLDKWQGNKIITFSFVLRFLNARALSPKVRVCGTEDLLVNLGLDSFGVNDCT